ncbi:MAG TPA: hypothetical protein VNK24_05515 [Elusimicrobiota bacterium]|nr:hypothetical protein [Elusimicrobiota bacterium]
MRTRTISGYFKLVFSTFFRWWWAVITGIASIAGWVFSPISGITIPRYGMGLAILGGLVLLFLTISAMCQCWGIYSETAPIRVANFEKPKSGDFVFLLYSTVEIEAHTLLVFKRYSSDDIETVVALVEVIERNSKGQYQTRSIWTSPALLRDLGISRSVLKDLIVASSISTSTIAQAKDQLFSGASS